MRVRQIRMMFVLVKDQEKMKPLVNSFVMYIFLPLIAPVKSLTYHAKSF